MPKQDICLENDRASNYMTTVYDWLQPHVRQRLRESPFNICSACVGAATARYQDPIIFIEAAEDAIRNDRPDLIDKFYAQRAVAQKRAARVEARRPPGRMIK